MKCYTIPFVELPRPTKVIGVHLNYRSRAAQRGRVPAVPSYFLKPTSSLAGDGDAVIRPQGTELLAFEGEVALIVGSRARMVRPEDGVRHVGWITAANDWGLYDLRLADHGSSLLSKGQDGYTPLGAAVPVADVDLGGLHLTTRVNGELVQEDWSANLLFSLGLLVADLSRFVTLEPGDVILSGTPAGSRPAEPGDLVEVEIEGVSKVASRVVESSSPLPDFGAQPVVTPAIRASAYGSNGERRAVLDAEALDVLSKVSTATLTVQLARRGIRNAFIAGVRPSRPGVRLLGYAFTVRYVPLREDVRDARAGQENAQRRAVEEIGPGEVLVIEARGETGAGTIGDILAARVQARGGAGVVTDGGLRDTAAVAGLSIPTYFAGSHPAVLGARHYPLEVNVPVACGGALVLPGDVLVGDADGVVVVPAQLAEEVARGAAEQEAEEAWALERVEAGESTRGVYPLSAARRQEFGQWLQARAGASSKEEGPAK